jgi:hypothetical protein
LVPVPQPTALPPPPLLLPTAIPLPSVTAAPGALPTVAVPLPTLPLITPTARVCVLLTCLNVG